MERRGYDPSVAGTSDDALRVLVVEDEPLLQWAISEELLSHRPTVSVAGDGASALRALTASSFDVVLLDLCLPDSRDLALLARIRGQWPATAVVMMTAHATPDVLDGAHQLGAHTILHKPFDLHSLPAILRSAHRSQFRPH
jgi:DNA-binding NtrC family response regulator